MEVQVEFLKTIRDSLGERLRGHQDKLLEVLQMKLAQANRDLDRVTLREDHGNDMQENKKIRSKRLKFVTALKACIEKTVSELEDWNRRFDPSWWLLLRLKSPSIDTQLRSTKSDGIETGSLVTLGYLRSELSAQESNNVATFEFKDQSTVNEASEDIPGSQARLGCLKASGRHVVIDTVKCDPAIEPALIMKDVQDLARILANADRSRFGLLPCYGAIKYQNKNQNPTAYELLFHTPSDVIAIQSLRDFLSGDPSGAPLNERIDIAKSLARAVLFLHVSHFVHKNLRPENVVIFRSGKMKVGKPYLVGFEKFRLDDRFSSKWEDDLWERNLYRHPHRQGVRPQEDFIMQHDVYSLGVVLLELGMSISFVGRSNGPDRQPPPASQLEISDLITSTRSGFGRASAFKERLRTLAETILPNTFGRKYSEVVLSCLTCLDRGNQDFGYSVQYEDDDGILVGVQYIEKVCAKTHIASIMWLTVLSDSFFPGRHLAIVFIFKRSSFQCQYTEVRATRLCKI